VETKEAADAGNGHFEEKKKKERIEAVIAAAAAAIGSDGFKKKWVDVGQQSLLTKLRT
jgi:hypothetical protein